MQFDKGAKQSPQVGELVALRLSSQIAPWGTIVFEIEPPHTPHLGIRYLVSFDSVEFLAG